MEMPPLCEPMPPKLERILRRLLWLGAPKVPSLEITGTKVVTATPYRIWFPTFNPRPLWSQFSSSAT